MQLKNIKKIITDIKDAKLKPLVKIINDLQIEANKTIDGVINKDIINGILHKDLSFTIGTQYALAHKLGRVPKGWNVSKKDSDANIYEVSRNGDYLYLMAKANVSIDNWIPYTPIWTAVTADPIIGNGSLEGWYRRIGDSVEIRIQIKGGNTTYNGNGVYSLSLPSGFVADTTKYHASNLAIMGTAELLNSGISRHVGSVRLETTTTVRLMFADTNNIIGTNDWADVSPFDFTTNDEMSLYASIPITGYGNITKVTSDIWVF